MAQLVIDIPNAAVAEVLAAVEGTWKSDAVRIYFAGDAGAYAAATLAEKGQALIKAMLRMTTLNQRRSQAEAAARTGQAEPDIT